MGAPSTRGVLSRHTGTAHSARPRTHFLRSDQVSSVPCRERVWTYARVLSSTDERHSAPPGPRRGARCGGARLDDVEGPLGLGPADARDLSGRPTSHPRGVVARHGRRGVELRGSRTGGGTEPIVTAGARNGPIARLARRLPPRRRALRPRRDDARRPARIVDRMALGSLLAHPVRHVRPRCPGEAGCGLTACARHSAPRGRFTLTGEEKLVASELVTTNFLRRHLGRDRRVTERQSRRRGRHRARDHPPLRRGRHRRGRARRRPASTSTSSRAS